LPPRHAEVQRRRERQCPSWSRRRRRTSRTSRAAPVEVKTLVTAFFHAFNERDTGRLDALFAPAEDFQWYSTPAPGERGDEEARSRSTLIAYFEERHKKGERLRLRSFQFNGNSDGYGNFQYRLVRSADDLPATQYIGKGAAYCFDGRPDVIFVWGMDDV
jgi:hypothetical protein